MPWVEPELNFCARPLREAGCRGVAAVPSASGSTMPRKRSRSRSTRCPKPLRRPDRLTKDARVHRSRRSVGSDFRPGVCEGAWRPSCVLWPSFNQQFQNSSLAELSDCSMGPRLRARRLTSAGKDRRQARRLNATGFAFAVVGRGELLMLLLFKAMLLLERARGRKAGGPPLLAPSLKVQRDNAHNQSSGFRRRSRRP